MWCVLHPLRSLFFFKRYLGVKYGGPATGKHAFIWCLCFNPGFFQAVFPARRAVLSPAASRHSGHVATESRFGRRRHLSPSVIPALSQPHQRGACVIELTSVLGRNPIGCAVRDRRRREEVLLWGGVWGGRPSKIPATTAGWWAAARCPPEAPGATLMKKQQQWGSAGVERCAALPLGTGPRHQLSPP